VPPSRRSLACVADMHDFLRGTCILSRYGRGEWDFATFLGSRRFRRSPWLLHSIAFTAFTRSRTRGLELLL
jgi:hypothetical protein